MHTKLIKVIQAITFLHLGILLFVVTNKAFAERITIDPKQEQLGETGNRFKEACRNYKMIESGDLAKQLVEHGELSVPIFEEALRMDNLLAISSAAWGLGQIRSAKALDILLERYEELDVEGKDKSAAARQHIIRAIGNSEDKARTFLEQIVVKDGSDVHCRVIAADILVGQGRHREAEDALLKYAPLSSTALEALDSREVWKHREKETISVAVAILKNPEVSEWNRTEMISSAGDILVKTNYEAAADVLSRSFDIQNNVHSKANIITALSKIKSKKAKEVLENISRRPGMAGWIKDKVNESLRKAEQE